MHLTNGVSCNKNKCLYAFYRIWIAVLDLPRRNKGWWGQCNNDQTSSELAQFFFFWAETPRFPVIHCAEALNYKIYSMQHLDGKNCVGGMGHGEFVLRCLPKITESSVIVGDKFIFLLNYKTASINDLLGTLQCKWPQVHNYIFSVSSRTILEAMSNTFILRPLLLWSSFVYACGLERGDAGSRAWYSLLSAVLSASATSVLSPSLLASFFFALCGW